VPNQAQCLAMNEDMSEALRRPSFVETPESTRLLDVVMMLQRWNLRVPCTACCDFHATLEYVTETQQILVQSNCQSLGHSHRAQCPECFALNLKGAEDSGSFICECCGCNGDALQEQASIPSLPRGAARERAAIIQAQHGNSDLAPLRISCSL